MSHKKKPADVCATPPMLRAESSFSALFAGDKPQLKKHGSDASAVAMDNALFSALVKIPSLQRKSTLQRYIANTDTQDGWMQDQVTLNFDADMSYDNLVQCALLALTDSSKQMALSVEQDLSAMVTDLPRSDPNFHIEFSMSPQNLGSSWAYSAPLNQVFVKLGALCPVRLVTQEPIEDYILRVSPRFVKTEHQHLPVRRCPNHLSTKDKSGVPPKHVTRLDNKEALYVTDDSTSHDSCYVVGNAAGRCLDRVERFQMMCFSSCAGGINRRPIQLVFTLEIDGMVVGSRAVSVRICACPSRDRKLAEEGPSRSKKKRKAAASRDSGRKHPKVKKEPGDDALMVTAIGTQSPFDVNDQTVYQLHVHGRENFLMIRKIACALNCLKGESVPEPAKADAIPTDQALASIKDVPGWLSTWGLGQHEAAFHKHGYDDLEVIEHLSAKDLHSMDISDKVTQDRLLEAAKSLVTKPPRGFRRHRLVPPAASVGEKVVRVIVRKNTAPAATTFEDEEAIDSPPDPVATKAPVDDNSPSLETECSLPQDSQNIHSDMEESQLEDSQ